MCKLCSFFLYDQLRAHPKRGAVPFGKVSRSSKQRTSSTTRQENANIAGDSGKNDMWPILHVHSTVLLRASFRAAAGPTQESTGYHILLWSQSLVRKFPQDKPYTFTLLFEFI